MSYSLIILEFVAKEHMRDNKIKGKDKDPILFGTFQRIDRSQDAFARVTSRVYE